MSLLWPVRFPFACPPWHGVNRMKVSPELGGRGGGRRRDGPRSWPRFWSSTQKQNIERKAGLNVNERATFKILSMSRSYKNIFSINLHYDGIRAFLLSASSQVMWPLSIMMLKFQCKAELCWNYFYRFESQISRKRTRTNLNNVGFIKYSNERILMFEALHLCRSEAICS